MAGVPKIARRTVSTEAISSEINRISRLKLAEVRTEWQRRFGKAPARGLSRDLLVRQLAWDIQERAFGGHDAATLKLLKAHGRQEADKVVLFRRLKPGATVIREYQGVRHIVTIAEGGFVWEGKTYASLSAIARAITGARWNGPRFFGLRSRDVAGLDRKAS
jgi:Protein of unknown function (DUF2924)